MIVIESLPKAKNMIMVHAAQNQPFFRFCINPHNLTRKYGFLNDGKLW